MRVLKASVYFYTCSPASHVASCWWINERREGGNSQTDTRLSRRNKHAEQNLIWPGRKVSGNDTVQTPFFPFLTGPKGGLGGERETKQCMPFLGWVAGEGLRRAAGRLSAWKLFVSAYRVHAGALYRGAQVKLKRLKMNKYEALSIRSVFAKSNKLE